MKKTIFISLIATLFLATLLPVYQGKAAIPATIEALGQVLQIQNWPSIFKVDITNKDSDSNIKIKSQGVVDVNIVNYPPALKTVWVWQNATNLQNGDYSPVFETNGWNKMYFDVRQTNLSSCGYYLELFSSLDGNTWLHQDADPIFGPKDDQVQTWYRWIVDSERINQSEDSHDVANEREQATVKAPYYRFKYFGTTQPNCNNEVLNAYVYLTQAINSLEY